MRMKGAACRVLVVDADPSFGGYLRVRLGPRGYDVDCAEGVAQAVERIKNVGFDCVVVSADLPRMEARDTIPIIKTVSGSTPVIVTSQENSWELEAQVRSQAIFYYHVKCFDASELEEAVADACKSTGKSDPAERRGRGARILIVDDDRDYVDSTRRILRSRSYQVSVAYDKEKALELIETERPDLVLLDMMMETMVDGLSVCSKIKHTPALQHIPVIIVTAMEGRSNLGACCGANGAVLPSDGYLCKPVSAAELLRSVAEVLDPKAGCEHKKEEAS
jgi:DNA-binding response OmpR family regulator